MFKFLDDNNTSVLSNVELEKAFKTFNIKVTDEQISNVLKEVDLADGTSLGKREFIFATMSYDELIKSKEGNMLISSIFKKF